MKILFDNGTPRPIARCLTGHEITYARRIGWHELENGELIQKAEEAGYEVLLSTDIFGDDLRQVRRPGFFFAFEDELDIGARRDVGSLEGIESGGEGGERRLIVAGGTGVNTPFGVDHAGRRQRHHTAALIEGTVAHDGFPRRSGPLLGVERLAIVVCVKDDGAVAPGVRISP